MPTMQTCLSFKSLAARFQRRLAGKRKPAKRTLQISAPFNFKHEASALPGVSEDEIEILKEKAVASRVGVSDGGASGQRSPRNHQRGTMTTPMRVVTPRVQIITSTPVSAADNVI